MHIEFQYTGNIDNDSLQKANDIADLADSASEAWDEVDKLDGPTCDKIWDVGSFLEYYPPPSRAQQTRSKQNDKRSRGIHQLD